MRSSPDKVTASESLTIAGARLEVTPAATPGKTRGLILHLQRLSTEDGPGIRTTVFFKGCPLRCEWCHNPESLSPRPQLHWLEANCIGCETCLDACPNQALAMTAAGVSIDRLVCEGCGTCAEACPACALELLGVRRGVSELCLELLKDRAYYEKSGGGVTLSGGEPSMQPEFARRVLVALQAAGVHTALDTSGMCSFASLEKLAAHADLVLYDLKEIDPERHRRFTGFSNVRILENLTRLAGFLATHPHKRLWVRTPLIPGRTARPDNLAGIGAFLATHLGGLVERWDLCAFNNLCAAKYDRLGLHWALAGTPLLAAGELAALAEAARRSGVDPQIVMTSGTTRLETM